MERRTAAQPGHCGVRLLRDGQDAFVARALLVRFAERTLDLQYYIWQDDLSGSLMLDEIEAAAERGVRVRLLLDDNGVPGLDDRLCVLNAHPNIEVRLYNPFTIRKPKALNWLFAFRRLNRRMHAKSFTVDNQVTIVGGRNIGDEYFGARHDELFVDLDVLALGPIVAEVSQVFDRHWNSRDARPAGGVLRPVSKRRRRRLAAQAATIARSAAADSYREAIRALPLFGDMIDGSVKLVWAPVRLISANLPGDPEPDRARTGFADLLPAGLGQPERELTMISAYFVPTRAGCADLARLVADGVTVRVLTNSFASTDVGIVHTGYMPYRQRLLAAGVELFEMPAPDDKPKTARKFVRVGMGRSLAALQAGTTLHAKAFAVDRLSLYVGSANFDPRSAHLNSEVGMVIDSPEMAGELSRAFEQEITRYSYRLGLDAKGRLHWTDERVERARPQYVEPGTSLVSRFLVRVLARLPLERLL